MIASWACEDTEIITQPSSKKAYTHKKKPQTKHEAQGK